MSSLPPGVTVTITAPDGSTGSAPVTLAQPTPPPPPPKQNVIIGCTCNPRAFGLAGDAAGIVQTAAKMDAIVGRPFATLGNKAYETHTPTYSKLPPKYTALGSGAHYLISVKPGYVDATTATPNPMPVMSTAENAKLAAFIDLLQAGGVHFDMAPWQENNLGESPFTAASFIAWYRYYAPTIINAGVRCVYDPGASDLATAQSFYPGDDMVSAVGFDYYNGAWHHGTTLDQLAAIADNRKDGKFVPVGVMEYGSSVADPTKTPIANATDYSAYCSDIVSFFQRRALAGKPVYGAICFVGWPGAPGHSTTNGMTDSSDFKVAGTKALIDALAAL